jgi:HAD superfamily hydrolase (TIGR01509 family)
MITTVIFDMDGVIINSEPAFQQIEKDMFREFGINMSDEEYITYVGTNIVEMWAWIAEKHGVKLNIDEVIAEEKRRYLAILHSDQTMDPIEGVFELIDDLHRADFRLTIASSSSCEIIKSVTEKFQIENKFDVLISSDMVENSKPSPDIFLKTAEAVQESSEKCLVIEDSENGVLAAKAANMKCIGFRSEHTGQQDLSKADWVVESIKEITVDKIQEIFN